MLRKNLDRKTESLIKTMLSHLEIKLLEAVFSDVEIYDMDWELIYNPEVDQEKMREEIGQEFHKRIAAIKARGGIQIEGLI